MARIGITENEIADAINALQAEGMGITVQAVRSKLGTGSYTTIQAALDRWRSHQTEVGNAVPEIPEKVLSLARILWVEAWKESSRNFDTEKAAFGEERQRFEVMRSEMSAEIDRLESEAAKLTATQAVVEEKLTTNERTIQELRLNHTREESQRLALENEVARLQQETATLRAEEKSWIERASKAEGRLEEYERRSPMNRIEPSA